MHISIPSATQILRIQASSLCMKPCWYREVHREVCATRHHKVQAHNVVCQDAAHTSLPLACTFDSWLMFASLSCWLWLQEARSSRQVLNRRPMCVIIECHPGAPWQVQVTCRLLKGTLLLGNCQHLKITVPSLGHKLLSPPEFEAEAGCSRGKNWKVKSHLYMWPQVLFA